uniref:Uncharacterized protein n=1 Tax=Lygus hesperus TaxID=30085 RepID=A0A0A9XC82_LYGHE
MHPYEPATVVDERSTKYRVCKEGADPSELRYRMDTSCYTASTGFCGFQLDTALHDYSRGAAGAASAVKTTTCNLNPPQQDSEDDAVTDENGWGYNTDFLLMKRQHTRNVVDGLGSHNRSSVFDICRRRRWYRDTLLVRFLHRPYLRYHQ